MSHTTAAHRATFKIERFIIADATEDDDFKGIQEPDTHEVPVLNSQPKDFESPRNESRRLFREEELKKIFLLVVYGSVVGKKLMSGYMDE